MTTHHDTALNTAKAFFAAFEGRDPGSMRAVLAPHANITIPLSIEGTPAPWYVFDGQEHVLGYVESVAAKFDHVAFLDKVYTVSADAKSVFLQANGDILATAEKLVYRNVYIFRVEVEDGKVVKVWEYANPVAYANLGIQNSDAEAAAQAR
ncbi:nuclear transport factor 2 family protein [Kitasatospora sp. NBC_00374]|uniref:nuclear transport factor 2 family protein n=1 Tax=Kitasatospora sp. NBC_00374 TaxID=2975964 RepID=UPI003254BBC9